MQLGIKTGLNSDWKKDILATRPDFCEIWFNASKIPAYADLMDGIARLGPGIGLHYWGALSDGTLSNIAYPDTKTRQESIGLIKATIDYAANYKCIYVNIHPSGRLLTKVDFTREEYKPLSESADRAICQNNFIQAVDELALFSKDRGVILTVETTPKYALGTPLPGTESRLKPIDVGDFSLAEISQVYKLPDGYFAHDFGHTAAQLVSANRQLLVNYVFDIARRLLAKTKLVHVGYIIPPYNGTDYHGSLYNTEVNSAAAVPNICELGELLKLYKQDPGIHALVEPETDDPGNFLELQKLIQATSS